MLAIGVLPFRAQQRLALKVNLLHAATTTPNLGVEYAFSPRMSAEIWGAYNLIDFRGDFSLRHYLAEVETRYWFDRPFSRHFVGAHALAGRVDGGPAGEKACGAPAAPPRDFRGPPPGHAGS